MKVDQKLSVSQDIIIITLKFGLFSIFTLTFWVVVWVRVRLETLKKQGHSVGTGEHPKILGVRVH